MEEKIIKQFSAKVEEIKSLEKLQSTEDKDFEKFLYVGSYITTYNVDLGKDIIAPGAFTKSIKDKMDKGQKIPLLLQHNMDLLLGHAIFFKEDNIGVYVESRLPKSHWRVKGEIIPLLENGSLQEFSVGFGVKSDDYEIDENTGIRTIKQATLYEYSFVTLAMNPEARLQGFKSMIEEVKTLKEAEKLLKKKGFSQSEAKALISKVKEFSKNPCDEEQQEKETQRDVEEKQQPEFDADEVLKSIEELTILTKINEICQLKK